MKELKCKNCGGTMVIDSSACQAECHYCGAVYVLDQQDTDFYAEYYKRMQQFLIGNEEEQQRKKMADEFWKGANTEEFEMTDENLIEIQYMHKKSGRVVDTYVARNNVIFRFHAGEERYLKNYKEMVQMIGFPPADSRNLKDFFPRLRGGYALKDESTLLVIEKEAEEYPLCAFGKLPPEHVAWIISRLENICCVLEYNGIVHPEISPENVYINPYNHSAMLYGGYEQAVIQNHYNMERTKICRMEDNLTALRKTGLSILEQEQYKIPKPLQAFFEGMPKRNAYDDFSLWDRTLIEAFGKRRFAKMDTNDEEIYQSL
ncbi:MAG: hypothetical protein ACI4ES_13610 [Roseburia sp.]